MSNSIQNQKNDSRIRGRDEENQQINQGLRQTYNPLQDAKNLVVNPPLMMMSEVERSTKFKNSVDSLSEDQRLSLVPRCINKGWSEGLVILLQRLPKGKLETMNLFQIVSQSGLDQVTRNNMTSALLGKGLNSQEEDEGLQQDDKQDEENHLQVDAANIMSSNNNKEPGIFASILACFFSSGNNNQQDQQQQQQSLAVDESNINNKNKNNNTSSVEQGTQNNFDPEQEDNSHDSKEEDEVSNVTQPHGISPGRVPSEDDTDEDGEEEEEHGGVRVQHRGVRHDFHFSGNAQRVEIEFQQNWNGTTTRFLSINGRRIL